MKAFEIGMSFGIDGDPPNVSLNDTTCDAIDDGDNAYLDFSKHIGGIFIRKLKRRISLKAANLWCKLLNHYFHRATLETPMNCKVFYDAEKVHSVENEIKNVVQAIETADRIDMIRGFLDSFRDLIPGDITIDNYSLFRTLDDFNELEILYNLFLRIIHSMVPALKIDELYAIGSRNLFTLIGVEEILNDESQWLDIPSPHRPSAIEYVKLSRLSKKLQAIISEKIHRLQDDGEENHQATPESINKACSRKNKQFDTIILIEHDMTVSDMTVRKNIHISPLFIIINLKEVKLICLDSLGAPYDLPTQSGYDVDYPPVYSASGLYKQRELMFSEIVASHINPTVMSQNNDRHSFQPIINFYSVKIERQYDFYSCPIYCIDDVLEYSKDFYNRKEEREEEGGEEVDEVISNLFDFIDNLNTISLNTDVGVGQVVPSGLHLLTEDESLIKNKSIPFYVIDLPLPWQYMKSIQDSKIIESILLQVEEYSLSSQNNDNLTSFWKVKKENNNNLNNLNFNLVGGFICNISKDSNKCSQKNEGLSSSFSPSSSSILFNFYPRYRFFTLSNKLILDGLNALVT